MSANNVMILGSVLFAATTVASAVLFRGQNLGDWIESILFVAFLMFTSCVATRAIADRRRRPTS